VVSHHQEVPYRVLEHKYGFTAPSASTEQASEQNESTNSGNKIIHGGNLEALKSLLPEYEGKIKCIYIDPPYNTGNEKWVYNDNVNHPKIKKWLGEVEATKQATQCGVRARFTSCSSFFRQVEIWMALIFSIFSLYHFSWSEKSNNGFCFMAYPLSTNHSLQILNLPYECLCQNSAQAPNDIALFYCVGENKIVT
jgi:hypothetical protein